MIEFKTVENALRVRICGYEMYFDFDEEVIIHSEPYIIKAVAKKYSREELCFYSTDGLFILRNGESINIKDCFKYDDGGLKVEVKLFWEVQS
jgi:hypothetical protein